MTPNEIIEGNRLIGNFMNLWIISSSDTKISEDQHWEDELEYHKSWNELMPVVEKIEALMYRVNIFRFSCEISHYSVDAPHILEEKIYHVDSEQPKIHSVYQAVIKFLHWHNSVKK
jgi:hypothetical protein